MPFGQWPAEARLLLGMVALWCGFGLLVLGSASWWVAAREMGDPAFYLKRQLLWLIASWGLLYLALRLNLRRWLRLAFRLPASASVWRLEAPASVAPGHWPLA